MKENDNLQVNLCCVFNYASHYRKPIYLELAKNLNAHFYFGERLRGEKIRKLDLALLPGFKKELAVYFFHFFVNFEWTSGMIPLAFNKDYKKYLITPNLWALNQWIFVFICWILGKDVYTWEHGLKTKKIRTIWLVQMRVFYYFIKGVFLYGNKARETMMQLGFREGKFHVIYNSLDYKEALALRKELKPELVYFNYFKNNDPVLLFIGRITKIKKLELLISAQEILFNKGLKTNVVLIGDGDILNELKNMVEENKQTERFWFMGALYEEKEISRFLFNADICISPGNVGLTAIHSFSYGLPVITNDNFETQMPEHEIIEVGKTGLFFREDNAESLAEKIEWWLFNKIDRNQIRNDCYEQIDNYYNPLAQIRIFERVLNG